MKRVCADEELGGVLSIRPVNLLGVLLCILGLFVYCRIFANAKGRDTVMTVHSRLSKGTTQKKKVHKINKEVFKLSFGPDGVIRGPSGNVSSTVYPLSDDEDPCDEGEDKVLELQEDNFSLFFKDRQMKIRTRLIGKTPHTERLIKEVVEPSGKSLARSKYKTNEIKAEYVAKLLGPLVMFGMLGLRLRELFDQAKSEAPGELYRGIVNVVISLVKVAVTFVLNWYSSSGGDSTGQDGNDGEDQ